MNREITMIVNGIRFALVFFLVSFFAGGATAGVNTWSTNGPEGGAFIKAVYDPINASIVYAAAQRGVYKSTDGGQHWTLLKSDFSNYSLMDIALDPSDHTRLYVVS